MYRNLLLGLGIGGLAATSAQELKLSKSAILSGTLPASTHWQIETQQGSSPWTGTGVMLPGRGSVTTLRMAGWPGDASYRFRRIDGGATVTGSLASGWQLSGSASAVGEQAVLIQASANLATWTPRELLYPNLEGRYARAVDTLPVPRGFFRAQIPATAARDSSVTAHTPLPNYEGASGFGPIYDDMPQLFKDGFIGALDPDEYHRDGQNAAAAGECYELAGPHGRTTVMITDTTDAPAGTVEVGRSFYDLGPEPLKVLTGGSTTGGCTAGTRLVPAPVTGNVKLFVVPGSSIYYTQLRAYNYRAGVTKIEIRNNGSSNWIDMPRSTFNSFVFQATSTPLSFPVSVRITSRFGEIITFPSIAAMVDNQKITGPAQFGVFPELAPPPEHRVRPAYHDALTNVFGDMWSSGGYGGATVAEVDSSVRYAGTASLRISGFANFAGVSFSNYPGFPRPGNGMLKLAIRSAAAVPAGQAGMWVHGANTVGGSQVISPYVLLPQLGTGWQVVRIPLEASGVPPIIWGFGISANTGGSLPNLWLDEIEFEER